MPKSPELPKFFAQKRELTPEHYAIRIQAEFLNIYPEFKEDWPKYSKLFRNYFERNKNLCIELFSDEEKKSDLFELIRLVLEEEFKKQEKAISW